VSTRAANLTAIATTRAERWALGGVSSERTERLIVALTTLAAGSLLAVSLYRGNLPAIGIAGLALVVSLGYLGRVILIRIIERQAREIAALRSGARE
jgi:hypothetical protein